MAGNEFITPSNVSRAALGFWQEAQVLCGLFNRAYETDFGGGSGDTITIRKQASLTAGLFSRTTGIDVQDVVEDKVTVTVNDIYDVSVEVTQEQWDMDVFDFNWQVAEPAGRALARKAESLIGAKLHAKSATSDLDPADVMGSLVAARAGLNKAEVPLDNRFLVVGSDAAAVLLSDQQFLDASKAGSSEGLRSASLGRVLGMDVYESVVVTADEAYICHKDALTFVSIVPQVARGTTEGATSTYDGLGLRTVFSYDINKKQDIVSFDSYYEVADLRGSTAFVRLIPKSTTP